MESCDSACEGIEDSDTGFMVMATTFVMLQTQALGLCQAGAFIRGTLRRPPSFEGALEACGRLIEQARFDHRFSKACPRDEGPSDGGGSDAEDGYDQSGSQPDDSESGDCDTDSARDDFTSEQTGVPRCRFFAAGYCRQGDQCRFAH